jgi:drug/metabolite transporter (DMT)-like permease
MLTRRQIPQLITNNAPILAMVFITMIWGTTFLLVKHGLTVSSPMFFVGCRFAAATIAIVCLSFRQLKRLSRKDVIASIVIGLSIAIGYGAQTIGLQYITSSESAFFTALYVPFVPLILWSFCGKRPHVMSMIGIALAFVGLIFISGISVDNISLNLGQLLTLCSAVGVAVEIILISYYAPRVNLQCVTVLQLAFASIFAFMSMPFVGETTIPSFSYTLVIFTVGLGIASAFIQWVMNWAQRVVEPSTAAVIYAGEPVWAGIFGRLAGERLAPLALMGGVLVVASILISQYRPKFKRILEQELE